MAEKMSTEELAIRFMYHPPKELPKGQHTQQSRYEQLRKEAGLLAGTINNYCPESREKSLAITKIEEAVFWANSAIARRE
jgi:hypothetical protein